MRSRAWHACRARWSTNTNTRRRRSSSTPTSYVVWLEHPDGACRDVARGGRGPAPRSPWRPRRSSGPLPERLNVGRGGPIQSRRAQGSPAPRRPERGRWRSSLPCARGLLREAGAATHGPLTRRADRQRPQRTAGTDHRRRAPPRRQLPVHPGAARRGQDVHRLARDRGAARGWQARGRLVEQPQGHQQPARGRRGGADRERTEASAGRQEVVRAGRGQLPQRPA